MRTKHALWAWLVALALCGVMPAEASERERIDLSDLLKDVPPSKEESTLPEEAVMFQKSWWWEATPQDRISMCTANAHRLFVKTLSFKSSQINWVAVEQYDKRYKTGQIHLRKANPGWMLSQVFALIEAQEEKIETFTRPFAWN